MQAAGIVARLRSETRSEHDAIEQALAWEARAAHPDSYREWIQRLYGFHRSWEPEVARALSDRNFFDPRRKLHLLADDLEKLGTCASGIADLALPRASWAFESPAEALGSMYVIEGSLLGGRLIARHVAAAFGFRPRYHAGYGKDAGAMWRAFQERLERSVGPALEQAAIRAATRTFVELRAWLTAPDRSNQSSSSSRSAVHRS